MKLAAATPPRYVRRIGEVCTDAGMRAVDHVMSFIFAVIINKKEKKRWPAREQEDEGSSSSSSDMATTNAGTYGTDERTTDGQGQAAGGTLGRWQRAQLSLPLHASQNPPIDGSRILGGGGIVQGRR